MGLKYPAEDSEFLLFREGEAEEGPSQLPTASCRREVECEVLSSSPLFPVPGHVGMAKTCIGQEKF